MKTKGLLASLSDKPQFWSPNPGLLDPRSQSPKDMMVEAGTHPELRVGDKGTFWDKEGTGRLSRPSDCWSLILTGAPSLLALTLQGPGFPSTPSASPAVSSAPGHSQWAPGRREQHRASSRPLLVQLCPRTLLREAMSPVGSSRLGCLNHDPTQEAELSPGPGALSLSLDD